MDDQRLERLQASWARLMNDPAAPPTSAEIEAEIVAYRGGLVKPVSKSNP
jgi:hypothetical protein